MTSPHITPHHFITIYHSYIRSYHFHIRWQIYRLCYVYTRHITFTAHPYRDTPLSCHVSFYCNILCPQKVYLHSHDGKSHISRYITFILHQIHVTPCHVSITSYHTYITQYLIYIIRFTLRANTLQNNSSPSAKKVFFSHGTSGVSDQTGFFLFLVHPKSKSFVM